MKIIAKTLLASSLCMLVTVPVHAGRYHDDGRLVDRMERQHERIVSGLESGELTRREGRMLKKQKHKTRNMVRTFSEDGELSKKERGILHRQLNKRSERIWEFMHNDSDRHAFRDTCRNTSWHHRYRRHHQHGGHHEGKGGIANWFSDSEAWPRYGFLSR
jgi:hypothetical protein